MLAVDLRLDRCRIFHLELCPRLRVSPGLLRASLRDAVREWRLELMPLTMGKRQGA